MGVAFAPAEDFGLAVAETGLLFATDALALARTGFDFAGAALAALTGTAFAFGRASLAFTGAPLTFTGATFATGEAFFGATFLAEVGLPSDFAVLDLGINLGSKVSRLCWRNMGGGKK
jgi:hypothetical protein